MATKLMDSFVVDACRRLHPEARFDVEAVNMEIINVRKMALLKGKNNIDNREDVEMYYFLQKVGQDLTEEEIRRQNGTNN